MGKIRLAGLALLPRVRLFRKLIGAANHIHVVNRMEFTYSTDQIIQRDISLFIAVHASGLLPCSPQYAVLRFSPHTFIFIA